MQTVLTTPTFERQARAAGLADEEVAEIVSQIAAHPVSGELIVGTGGARKLRFARQGSGKSGGYRTIHYFGGEDVPVFLLALVDKGRSGKPVESGAKRTGCAVAADRGGLRCERRTAGLGDEEEMMSTFGQDLIQSAREALAIAKGEAEPSRAFVPPPVDVAAIRKKTGLSQDRFARRYGFSPSAVRDWEQRRRIPDPAARTLLIVIDREPQAVDRALRVG